MGNVVSPDALVIGGFYVATNCDGHAPDVEVPFTVARAPSYAGLGVASGPVVWGFSKWKSVYGYRTHGMDLRGWLNLPCNKDIVIREDHDRRLDPRPKPEPKPPKVKPPKPLTRMEMLEVKVAELAAKVMELESRMNKESP